MTKNILTQERLKELLSYDKVSGNFTCLVATSSRRRKGDVVGCIDKSNRYRVIGIDGVQYLAHRLVWLYCYGHFPKGQIDHKSHCRDDNSLDNLRVTSSTGNNRNKTISKRNTSGYNGVYWDSKNKKWRARIKRKNKNIELGSFDNKLDAAKARKDGDIKYGFHKNHGEKING